MVLRLIAGLVALWALPVFPALAQTTPIETYVYGQGAASSPYSSSLKIPAIPSVAASSLLTIPASLLNPLVTPTGSGSAVLANNPAIASPTITGTIAGGAAATFGVITVSSCTGCGGGGGSLTLTDGTHTVTPTTQITVTGGTVGGTTPNATLTISGGGSGFAAITGGTNTSAAMVVGTGASLGVSGSGTIAATSMPATGLTGTLQAAQFPALTGDLTTPGASLVSTLATVNSNIGTFASETVNGKGLVTAAGNLTGDATTSGAALTLATVNSNVGSFTNANITVNGKGLITAAANGSGGSGFAGYAGTTAGTANAQTIASPSPSGWTNTDQNVVFFKVGAGLTNTAAAPTLAISSQTAEPMDVQAGGVLVSLPPGYLVAAQQYSATYQSACTCFVVTTTPNGGVTQATTSQAPTSALWAVGQVYNLNAASLTITPVVSTTLSSGGSIVINAINAGTLAATSPDTITTSAGTTGAGGNIALAAGTVTVVTSDGAGHLYAAGNTNAGSGCTVSGAAGILSNSGSSTCATDTAALLSTGALSLGSSGVAGSVAMGNATSGTITLQPVTGALGSVTLSLPAATDQLVGRATTDTLTNKTLTSPTINAGALSGTFTGTPTFSGNLTFSGVPVFSGTLTGTQTQCLGLTSGNALAATSGACAGTPVVFTGTTAGTANAQTIASPTPGGFALTNQNIVRFTASATNTGASTLNVAATGATAIDKQLSSGFVALAGGEIVSGLEYDATYNSTCTCFVLTNTPGSAIVNNATSATVTAAQWANVTLFNVTTSGQTITLPVATTLASNGGIFINAIGNSVTLAPNAADGINGGSTGSSVTVASGVFAVVSTVGSSGTGAITANPLTGGGGGGGLTVGTTTIASGTNGSVEFNNSGVLGEKTVSGTGSLIAATSGSLTSPTITGGALAGTFSGGATFSGNLTLSGSNSFTGADSFVQAYSPPVALTDASTVAVNAALANNFTLLMTSGIGATRALGNPTNLIAGQVINFVVTQDVTGGRLLTFGANYSGGITLNPGANAVTVFSCLATSSSALQCAGGAANGVTASNCSNGASPAVCISAKAGSVAVPTGVTPTLVVNTTAVTASSEILLQIDESATIASTTCNTTLSTLVQPVVTARTPGTSFTMQINATLAANPACVNYLIVN